MFIPRARHPGKPNLRDAYRIQRYDKRTTGIHWQIGRAAGSLLRAEQQNEPLNTTSLFLGGPPAMILAAIAQRPEDVPELMLASLLIPRSAYCDNPLSGHHRLIAESEFAICGRVPPHERRRKARLATTTAITR
ncbi:MAG: UbiD family decarboxylase [Acidobacteria bacterium]|nr:UbiD family decarboxylase [Acidobacteriota bacterium]